MMHMVRIGRHNLAVARLRRIAAADNMAQRAADDREERVENGNPHRQEGNSDGHQKGILSL